MNLLINDLQIREKVLGSTLSREEEEVIQAIHDASRDSDDITNSVDSSLTNAIISELNVDRYVLVNGIFNHFLSFIEKFITQRIYTRERTRGENANE